MERGINWTAVVQLIGITSFMVLFACYLLSAKFRGWVKAAFEKLEEKEQDFTCPWCGFAFKITTDMTSCYCPACKNSSRINYA